MNMPLNSSGLKYISVAGEETLKLLTFHFIFIEIHVYFQYFQRQWKKIYLKKPQCHMHIMHCNIYKNNILK